MNQNPLAKSEANQQLAISQHSEIYKDTGSRHVVKTTELESVQSKILKHIPYNVACNRNSLESLTNT